MLSGLKLIRMEMSLLAIGMQLMTVPTTSLLTMNVTPLISYWCFESSLPTRFCVPRVYLYWFLQTLFVDFDRANDVPPMALNSSVSFCTFPRACREQSFVSWCFEPSQPQRITSGLIESRRSISSCRCCVLWQPAGWFRSSTTLIVLTMEADSEAHGRC